MMNQCQSRREPATPTLDAARRRCAVPACIVGLRHCFKAIAFTIGAVIVFAATTPALSEDADLSQEKQMLRVVIAGKTVRLEAVIVKRADAKGRLPVAFMNHGRPHFSQTLTHSLTTMDPGVEMADIARRGWLVVAIHRRGYGLSDGPLQSDSPCSPDAFMSWMNSDADDIQASIELIAKRPDADTTRMITMGISAGGGTSVALGARNIPGLAAAINIAGGESFPGCAALNQSIPADFRALGSRSRIPNLWIFAENDRNHPPDQVEIMRKAFSDAGADLKLAMLPAMGSDGHAAMASSAGRTKWLVEVDTFLRDHDLPTWPLSNVDEVLRKLKWPASSRAYVQGYLAAPAEKALAYTPGTQNASYNEAITLDAASNLAMTGCQQKGRRCVIAMLNDTWIGGMPTSAASPAALASLRCAQALNTADFAAAVADCTQAINLNPKDDSAYANRCGANDNLKNYTAALPDCMQAIKLNPKNESAYVNRCFANIGLDEYGNAVTDCTQALKLNPQDERAYNSRCLAYNFEGDFISASSDCNKAIELNPNYVFAYTNLCAASFGLGNYNDVIEQCSKAVALDPKAESAYVSLCGANNSLGNHKTALEQCNRAVALDPRDEQAYNNRCNVHNDLGNFSAAAADCKQAIAINSKFAPAYDSLCNVYNGQGDFSAAVAACSQAIARDAKDDYAYVHRGIAYEGMKNYKDALADYNQAISVDRNNVEALNGRCWVLAITGSPKSGLEDCIQAVALKPRYPNALDSLGFVYLQLGNYGLAVENYNSALNVSPKLASSLYGRGWAKLKNRDNAGGNADIEAAKAIDPNIASEMGGFGLR
jgi:tetratricopeptide (TPR) repeat protein/dienelactone hydrolase